MILLVAFSFAQRTIEEEPNPCNIRIAKAVLRTVDAVLKDGKGHVAVVAEWEVSKALWEMGFRDDHFYEVSINQTRYMGSAGVWDVARQLILFDEDVSEIILIANRFIHLHKVKQLAKQDNFRTNTDYESLIGRIGFDRKSNRRWARDPFRLFLYAIHQRWTGFRG